MTDKWKEDTLGIYGAYDFGWVMRPRPKNPSQEDLVRGFVEELSNPFAALLRIPRVSQMKTKEEELLLRRAGFSLSEDLPSREIGGVPFARRARRGRYPSGAPHPPRKQSS